MRRPEYCRRPPSPPAPLPHAGEGSKPPELERPTAFSPLPRARERGGGEGQHLNEVPPLISPLTA
ncbi:hypothetical protein CO2235_150421 [Cupriavidus oxalaticus]|uniref:Uncharacterized protein n=1 Tax=Cupriavidus oxalaticus TaxID=96344 RepID=A0A375FP42_9BURK|nr:hypothetical protein CO2235_U670009 [Cupriavidus oxalaticus]SPC12766.1 hypothetical protein CO2235_150421 [Cupriavidus oxalaticus]